MNRYLARSISVLILIVYIVPFFGFMVKPAQASTKVERYSQLLKLPVNKSATIVLEKKAGTSTASILVSDYLDSTKVKIVDHNESADQISYYPYGEAKDGNSAADTNRQYTGQRKVSSDSPVYDYRARYFNPQTAIFVQPDSVEGPNRYAYVAGNPVMYNDPSGNVMTTGFETGTGGSTVNNNDRRLRESLKIADIQNKRLDTSLGVTGTFDPDVIDKALMTDDQFFTLQVLGAGLLTGGAAATVDLGIAPMAMLQSAVASKIRKELVTNFTVGSLTSGGMEFVAQNAMNDHVNTSQVVHSAIYGGLSQAISFGLLSPEKIAGSRFMTAFSRFMPQIPTKIASWAPALLVDSAIWTPQSIDPEKKDYVDSYKFQLTTQTGLQTAISGLDAAGERFLSRSHLGSKFFLFGTGLLMANMWANKGTSYPVGSNLNAISKP